MVQPILVLKTSPVTASGDDDDNPEGAQVPQRHTAKALAAQMGRVITDWGIQVSAVVHDNAANVKALGVLNDTCDVGCAAHKLS